MVCLLLFVTASIFVKRFLRARDRNLASDSSSPRFIFLLVAGWALALQVIISLYSWNPIYDFLCSPQPTSEAYVRLRLHVVSAAQICCRPCWTHAQAQTGVLRPKIFLGHPSLWEAFLCFLFVLPSKKLSSQWYNPILLRVLLPFGMMHLCKTSLGSLFLKPKG